MKHELIKGAVISPCKDYRYRLWRIWDAELPRMYWVMLNPSTADADRDDPTVKACMDFAKRANNGGIEIVNLFAYRTKSPAELKSVGYLVGPENDATLTAVFERIEAGSRTVAAWGTHGTPERMAAVRWMALMAAEPLFHLGLNRDGSPMHPLYVSRVRKFKRWEL